MEDKKTFSIATLGCRTNQYEGAAFRNQMESLGLQEAAQDADLCIVNTCTVTQGADRDSRAQVRRYLRQHPRAKVFVTGCFAESGQAELEALSDQVQVVPNAGKEALIEAVFPGLESYPEFSIKQFDAHTRAFVKVQDGCNSFCTYCIIPYVRGRSRSRSVPEILQEVRTLVAQGYREIVLTGINIGDFDGGAAQGGSAARLSDLVYAVNEIEGVDRIRISSIDPDEVEDDLLEAISSCEKACASMHLVLQSGSNIILHRMNRKYTKQIFFDSVERLRGKNPDFTFTTDVIVGFPGETEEDFAETLDVVESIEFAKVHMFPYSPRPRTRAALYKNPVSKPVITERKSRLLRLSEQVAYRLRERFIGRTMTVLTESKDQESFGHTENFLPVYIQSPQPLPPNQLVEVALRENTARGLIGELCS